MFFGLMGLAALVIDMGFARLAQRQMQTAVDSAALEGLRWRCAATRFSAGVAAGCGFPNPSDELWHVQSRYCPSLGCKQRGCQPVHRLRGPEYRGNGVLRRRAGRDVQRWDRSPSGHGCVPGDAAGDSAGLPANRADGITAGLELNTGNAPEGDMVAGTCSQNLAYDQQSPRPRPTRTITITAATSRLTSLPARRPTRLFWSVCGALTLSGSTSNNTSSLDLEPDISSSGLTLPLLFGRGSMMARSGGIGQLSVSSGITVRATAIAAAGTVTGLSQTPYEVGRALTVGRPNAAYSVPGSLSATMIPTGGTSSQLYYVVVYLSQWKSFSATSRTTLVVGADLMLTEGTTTCGYVADGSAVDPNDVSSVYPNGRPFLGPAAMVGDQANIPAAVVVPGSLVNELASELSPTGIAYVPIIDDTGGSASNPLFDRVVGFGYVSGLQLNGGMRASPSLWAAAARSLRKTPPGCARGRFAELFCRSCTLSRRGPSNFSQAIPLSPITRYSPPSW